jgi:hypothetical protein
MGRGPPHLEALATPVAKDDHPIPPEIGPRQFSTV